MALINEPPVLESFDPNKSEQWRVFLRDLYLRTNERLVVSATLTPGKVITTNTSGEAIDGVTTDTDAVIDDVLREYTGERYITENLLPEAGTEHGSRFGSYRIGLLTEDDYVFFDENGKAIFYGTSGIQIRIPTNSDSVDKIAVFDTSGNLEYRTIEQLADDLSGILATKEWASETFITENLLPEAGTEDYSEHAPNVIRITLEDSPYYAPKRMNGHLVVFADTNDGAITVNLPAGGEEMVYKLINAGTSGNDLTVDPNGTEQLYQSGAGVASTLADGENIDIHFNEVLGWA